jgi:RHS repeat-associated protein
MRPVVRNDVAPPHVYKFTGKERDTESGLDNFSARFHGSSIGRLMSPDPLQPTRSHPLVFQQFLADPQNWNKYAYSLNSPAKDTDQGGYFTSDDHERIQMNAMLASGYSQLAAHAAAKADRRMDNPLNMASGVPILHYFTSDRYQNQVNPQHGERGDHQPREQAQGVASAFTTSKISDDCAARRRTFNAST